MSILFRTKGWLTIAQLVPAWTPEIQGAERDSHQFEQELAHLLLEDIINKRLDDAGPLAEGRRLGLRIITFDGQAGFLEGHQGTGPHPSWWSIGLSFASDHCDEGGRARFRAPTWAADALMVERHVCSLDQAGRPFDI